MNKFVSFGGINYAAATFPVSSAAISYLKANHLDAKTGNVDINGKNLAVKLNTDGTIGFGTAAPVAGDELLGIIITYEEDGFATVQIQGGIDGVPTAAALTSGLKALGVDDKGNIAALTGGRVTTVALPSTSSDLFASIILN